MTIIVHQRCNIHIMERAAVKRRELLCGICSSGKVERIVFGRSNTANKLKLSTDIPYYHQLSMSK